jgi:hypothetical protein
MASNKTRRRGLTDRQFLASAWNELKAAPKVIQPGRPSSTRTALFSARYRGLCDRCGRWIDRGDEVRYHRDFSRVVHSGCRPPALNVTKVTDKVVVTNARMPGLCPGCDLEHAGECL